MHSSQHSSRVPLCGTLFIGALVWSTLAVQAGLAQSNSTLDTAQAIVPPVASTPWDSTGTGWSGRLVVGEYQTGVFCGYCQVHDVAFNALLRRYPETAFVSLAFHFDPNFPLADPADSTLEHFNRWYGMGAQAGILDQLPVKGNDDVIDGRSFPVTNLTISLNGGVAGGSAHYEMLAHAVDAELRRPPEAFFRVQAHGTGGSIQVQVKVDSLTGTHPKTFLRLLLVEDTVTFLHPRAWYNQRLAQLGEGERVLRREHHMVVRAVAHVGGLSLGLPLSGPGTVQYTFDVAALQQRHLSYHTEEILAMRPYHLDYMSDTANVRMIRDVMQAFPDAHDWQINPQRLHVIVFVQDAHTGAVLQAAMVNVSGQLQLP